MKIVFNDTTIGAVNVDPKKHVIAGKDVQGRIVLLRRKLFEGEGFCVSVLTIPSLESGNTYSGAKSGGEPFQEFFSYPHIEWHAFNSMRDFFVWAAEETNE